MPRRLTPLISGEYYHVYSRGNNRQVIFWARENYLFFLRRMRDYFLYEQPKAGGPEVSKASGLWPAISVIAYCLMPNHFHLLLQPHDDSLSRRMQRLLISYTKAINERFDRVGALFQGQFQAIRVDSDEYLLHLSRYIHLNPVAAGLVQRPEAWEFSSYREFVGLRKGSLVRPEIILGQFSVLSEYRQFVEAYLPSDRERIAHLLFSEQR